MLSVIYTERRYAESQKAFHAECCYAKCHYPKWYYTECRYAECHYPKWYYTECRYAECRDAA
jgi:hypothetical protein